MNKCLCGHFESCKACNPFKKTKRSKREKPINGRVHLVATEIYGELLLDIFYPNGFCESLTSVNSEWIWEAGYCEFWMAEISNKALGWKTHFLGNL